VVTRVGVRRNLQAERDVDPGASGDRDSTVAEPDPGSDVDGRVGGRQQVEHAAGIADRVTRVDTQGQGASRVVADCDDVLDDVARVGGVLEGGSLARTAWTGRDDAPCRGACSGVVRARVRGLRVGVR